VSFLLGDKRESGDQPALIGVANTKSAMKARLMK
jgi:hypothetical protein